MLEMRQECERCEAALPADTDDAYICSHECTFCASCSAALGQRCPNCNGIQRQRPSRLP
jgi:uncharacterized protein